MSEQRADVAQQDIDPTNRWVLIKVMAGHERLVPQLLTELGYRSFCPFYVVRRCTTRGRIRSVEKPLFPTYVFCQLTAGANGRIISVPGVVGLAGSKWLHRVIEDDEIKIIQNLAKLNAQPLERHLAVGAAVRVTGGTLKGLDANVIKVKPEQNRVVVSVQLLQRSVAVEIDEGWVSDCPFP